MNSDIWYVFFHIKWVVNETMSGCISGVLLFLENSNANLKLNYSLTEIFDE